MNVGVVCSDIHTEISKDPDTAAVTELLLFRVTGLGSLIRLLAMLCVVVGGRCGVVHSSCAESQGPDRIELLECCDAKFRLCGSNLMGSFSKIGPSPSSIGAPSI